MPTILRASGKWRLPVLTYEATSYKTQTTTTTHVVAKQTKGHPLLWHQASERERERDMETEIGREGERESENSEGRMR